MLSKKIKRKSRRQGIKLLKITGIFVGIFAVTILLLFVITSTGRGGIVSPLSAQRIQSDESSEKSAEDLKRLLKKNKVAFKNVSAASGKQFVVQLDPTGEVVLSSEKDMQKQISSLQVILTRLTMEGKAVVRLDLRYDKPVIVLK